MSFLWGANFRILVTIKVEVPKIQRTFFFLQKRMGPKVPMLGEIKNKSEVVIFMIYDLLLLLLFWNKWVRIQVVIF